MGKDREEEYPTGHDENLGQGDIVMSDVGGSCRRTHIVFGRVQGVDPERGSIKMNLGDNVTFTTRLESVELVLHAVKRLFPPYGTRRSKGRK